MQVRFDEAGQDCPVAVLEDFSAGPDEALQVGARADGQNPSGCDGHRLGPRPAVVHGDQRTGHEQFGLVGSPTAARVHRALSGRDAGQRHSRGIGGVRGAASSDVRMVGHRCLSRRFGSYRCEDTAQSGHQAPAVCDRVF